MAQDSIVIFRNIAQSLSVLPAELYKRVSEMVYAYAFDDIEPSEDTDPATMALFLSFKPQLTHNKERYESYVERGKKGGAPKGNANARKAKQESEEEKQAETSKNNLKQPKTTCDKQKQAETSKNEVKQGKTTNINKYISINNNSTTTTISAHAREEANENFIKEFFAVEKQAQIETLCMQLKTTPGDLQKQAREIIAEWELTEARHEDYNDQARHLIAQLRIKYNAKLKEQKNGRTTATGASQASSAKDRYSEVRNSDKAKKPLRSTI